MNITWLFAIIITFASLIFQVLCQLFDGDSCIQAHNTLRSKHVATNKVEKSQELENYASRYARQLIGDDRTIVIHPTRAMPKRKRRSVEDGIDETLHLELWDGDIYYPSANDNWLDKLNRNRELKIGRSIHKMCCTTKPHCPKEFFHGLSFPPTAEGVVNDLYQEEEKYYEYDTGRSKTIYSHIDHFAKVVWKNTTMVGCGQATSQYNCVFTVILYQREGAVGDAENYVRNIGNRISSATGGHMKKVAQILLGIFITGIVIALIVLIYCCRHRIDEKYKKTIINIDVLKAEQELETDSTSFWWMRPLMSKEKMTPSAAPAYQYTPVKSQHEVAVVTPARPPQPSLRNIPRPALPPAGTKTEANASQLVNRYRGMSLKRNEYQQLRKGALTENEQLSRPPMPPSRPLAPTQEERSHDAVVRAPSGKPAPPPVPRNVVDNRTVTTSTDPPTAGGSKIPSRPPPPQAEVEKPRPVPRKLPVAPGPSGKKPTLPSKPTVEEEKPMSVSDRRKLLEQ